MTFSSNACLYLLESVVSLLLGSPLIFQIVLPRVLFCSSRSSWRPTPFGLPQGSVLGPLLHILFTAEIGSLLASCSLLSHSYADDVQAYKHCLASDARSAILSVSRATMAFSMNGCSQIAFESFENSIYLAWHPPAVS